MITLSMDPGINGCGVGLFRDAKLIRASYVRNPLGTKDPLPERIREIAFAVRNCAGLVGLVDRVIYEWPQVYQGSKQEGDPNDLTKLAGVCAAVGALFDGAEVSAFGPREWKGGVNSNETARRILRRLDENERANFEDLDKLEAKLRECEVFGKEIKSTGCKQHNTCDGVGIGLKFLGRFERERVYAR